ncbi:autophagy protein 17 [Orbilia brochopaga]|uniref:Autophagy-related protein 17 n=1 Tax=Orbilia brochopaga TaxID=3140254 RepID=A0AAV9UJC4_9PEZI
MSTSAAHRNVADLTNWFLNAKRSLTSVTYCTRGNEIITSTRNAVIDASIMASRTAFLQGGIKDELKLLQRARSVMENQRDVARKEFQVSIKELDEANHRLDAILSSLRTTEVETAFSAQDKAEQKQRTLYDFVDEDGIENLRSQLRGVIDQVQETDENFESHLDPFGALLKSITESLHTLSKKAASSIPNPVVAISPSLQSMEEHASQMASLLESLATHYDLCSLALKRAESHDAGQEDDPETEEDKANMLAVLEKDAGEVDDVVNEIKERLDEMEATSVLVEKTVRDIGDHYRCVLGLLSKMHDGQNLLVTCTVQSKEFVHRQRDNQEVIAERLDELQRLTDHYVLFGDAYDALLVEVGRRIAVQRQKDAIIHDALAKIDILNEGDLNEREQFRSEYGDYLPSDIWPGLSDPPGAYMIQPTDVWEVPNVKPGVIENAMTRRAAAISSGGRQF